ncbi:cupin domain-containing protein [Kitasatospora sp. NPDC050543]|uniref:cupin domain-containing protein n=1 Tax=Kitasatospora sp. NPDC050543 TaxID=3364054 RepID=UPI003790F370
MQVLQPGGEPAARVGPVGEVRAPGVHGAPSGSTVRPPSASRPGRRWAARPPPLPGPPGGAGGEHLHIRTEEVHVLLTGRGEITLDGHPHPVRAGDAVLSGLGTRHSLRNPPCPRPHPQPCPAAARRTPRPETAVPGRGRDRGPMHSGGGPTTVDEGRPTGPPHPAERTGERYVIEVAQAGGRGSHRSSPVRSLHAPRAPESSEGGQGREGCESRQRREGRRNRCSEGARTRLLRSHGVTPPGAPPPDPLPPPPTGRWGQRTVGTRVRHGRSRGP